LRGALIGTLCMLASTPQCLDRLHPGVKPPKLPSTTPRNVHFGSGHLIKDAKSTTFTFSAVAWVAMAMVREEASSLLACRELGSNRIILDRNILPARPQQ
jgi:hypothetical protein